MESHFQRLWSVQHVLPCRPRCSIQNVNINILVEEKQLAFSLILMVKDFPTQPGTPWGLFVSSLSSGILGWCSFSWAKKHLQLMVKQLFSNLTFPPHTFDSFLYPCFSFLFTLQDTFTPPELFQALVATPQIPYYFFFPSDLAWPFSYVDHSQNSISFPISNPLHSRSKLSFICSSISKLVAGSLCVFLAFWLNILLGL